jgi:hypothetical protein
MGVSELLMNIKNQTSLHLSTQRIDRLVAASFANAVFHAANRAETHASDCGRNLPRIEDPQEERSFTQVILASLVFACISYVYETPQSLESALYSSRTARTTYSYTVPYALYTTTYTAPHRPQRSGLGFARVVHGSRSMLSPVR